MDGILVSIIIPIYNFGKYIERCINSIINQNYRNIEIIIINDGSTDDTKLIIEKLKLADNRITVINKKNEGVSIARNVGLEIAKGRYVMFVDGDDYLSPDAVEYMLHLIKESNAQFGLSLNCFTTYDELQVKNDTINIITPEEGTRLLLSPSIIVGCWNKIYDREFLLKYQIWFNPNLFYGEGLRFITQVSQAATRIVLGRRKVYYYRRNNYASATSQFNISKFINGEKSIDLISKDLRIKNKSVKEMLAWHSCQFYMGIVVRMKSAHKVAEYKEYYKSSLNNVRRNTWKFIFSKGITTYKKALLVGCCISPTIMALLDDIRRRKIAKNSII